MYVQTHTRSTNCLCFCVYVPDDDLTEVETCRGTCDKLKAVPLQAWSGPEGSRKLRFPDFMTTQDSGKIVSLTHRPPLPLLLVLISVRG